MKPHLRVKGGVWSCTSYRIDGGFYRFRIGYGNTVLEAWNDWKEQEFA